MCQYCNKSETRVEKLDDDEVDECEWYSEDLGPGTCAEPAAYAVSDWFVDDHLCEAHKLEIEREIEQGLGEFLENAGFHSQYEIKAIDEDETCDYVDPTRTDWKRCGQKARYAKYMLDTSLLCPAHAAEAQSESDKM